MKELTKRQGEVLSFITCFIEKNSYPPTIREIADNFGISVKGAHDHITALKRKKIISFVDNRPRTMKLTSAKKPAETDNVDVPILGTIAAGKPLEAAENLSGYLKLPRSMIKKNKEYFALKVKGDSMINAGILEDDYAIIEKQNTFVNGEIVVALIEESTTLKRAYLENETIRLQAENLLYEPIYSQDVKVLGRLSGIIRSY